MIPSLKQIHETRIKQRLVELKNDPQLLAEIQSFYDEDQLDQMHKALKSLTKIFSIPEFKSLTSFQLGFQKAASKLNDLLSTNRITRAIMLKSELKDIAIFTDGISRLMRQLPKIIDLAKDSISYEGEWDVNEPVSQIYQKASEYSKFKSLRLNIIKSMKPGMFSNMPYINTEEAATELLNLSLNQLAKLEAQVGRGRAVQQTVMNASFTDELLKVVGLIDKPDKAAPDKEVNISDEKTPKLALPIEKTPVTSETPATPETPGVQLLTVGLAKQDIQSMFFQSFKDTFQEKQNLTAREKVFREKLTIALITWLDQHGLIIKKHRR
jgi:hypothetical protein